MKIRSIKISNVLSFPYIDDFNTSPDTIVFDDQANILIGPNGSGKSNLIEILSKIMQSYLFTQFEFNESIIGMPNQIDKPFRFNTNNNRMSSFTNLVKHRDYKDKDSRLIIKLNFGASDMLNIRFVIEKFDELKTLSDEFTLKNRFFNTPWDFSKFNLDEGFDVTFPFKLNNKGNQFTIDLEDKTLTEKERFIHDYLEHFNFLQKLIEIGSTIMGKEWDDLKNSFAMISSTRQYGGFPNQISIGAGIGNQLNSLYQNSLSNSTKNYVSVDSAFQITCSRLAQKIRLNREGTYVSTYIQELMTNKESVLKRINDALAYIDLKVILHNFNRYNDSILVNIYDNKNEEVDFNELSTGQKNIFYLVFAVYGFDLKDGLLIIDEPELHLHTSMQKKYFEILKKISAPFNLQIILATHSPVFIDDSTIKNTFRFSIRQNGTIITHPKTEITHSQKDLLQILAYTNSSRIFFADIVILVEGDSDEYFFRYFYNNYYLNRRPTRSNVEFLSIGGKGNRKRWWEFLDLFGISSAFIGDFDNIDNEGVARLAGVDYKKLISDIKQEALLNINRRINSSGAGSKDGTTLFQHIDSLIQRDFVIEDADKNNLRDLWEYILERNGISSGSLYAFLVRNENAYLFKNLREEIVKKYSNNIYILQKGDLEAYLGISKDINKVIEFCTEDFQQWVLNEENNTDDSKLKELMAIMDTIVQGQKIE